MADAPSPPPPKVYEPGDPDPLRDGLFEGFWRHREGAVVKVPARG